eukprot:Hpha_TRINITY_DN14937_c0_g3::TRINITY_DN14937_c0_g3_i1::g.144502::m.144502
MPPAPAAAKGKKAAKHVGPHFKNVTGKGACNQWTTLTCPSHYSAVVQGLTGNHPQDAWNSYGAYEVKSVAGDAGGGLVGYSFKGEGDGQCNWDMRCAKF